MTLTFLQRSCLDSCVNKQFINGLHFIICTGETFVLIVFNKYKLFSSTGTEHLESSDKYSNPPFNAPNLFWKKKALCESALSGCRISVRIHIYLVSSVRSGALYLKLHYW
jgi:hypothetical protein